MTRCDRSVNGDRNRRRAAQVSDIYGRPAGYSGVGPQAVHRGPDSRTASGAAGDRSGHLAQPTTTTTIATPIITDIGANAVIVRSPR